MKVPLFSMIILNFFSKEAFSNSALAFKTPVNSGMGWFNYGLPFFILSLAVLYLHLKKHKKPSTGCRLLEKTYLNNKTVIYLLEYQEHRFLLAENQKGLCFHSLNESQK
ncbi:hypothetical protein B1207_05910 [Legionella quinlivanii]|uniref:Uncharacterized protein n=1 Tax=Legionella quinlivanii TaxID=45073 RepID=A0A364LK43_9GAMM|nr:hypothetical protein [Legionella quinlivanii]RAP36964.1 hypothetical protein B1207_05910 [Legionella quinlivanii]